MARGRSKFVEDALLSASARYGVPYSVLNTVMQLESGGNPTARTGSYQGLFQLSDAEFRRMMGDRGGDIMNPRDNAMAGAALLASHIETFRNKYNKEPSIPELFIIHNQGWGGYQMHRDNPDVPAWENMARTAEGRVRGPDWARAAIAGNIPRQLLRGRNPDEMTSREFLDTWNERIANYGGRVPIVTNEQPMQPQIDYEAGENLARAFTPAEGRSGPRQPAETPATTPEPGFRQQLMASIFGEGNTEGQARTGAALRAAGAALATPTKPRPDPLAATPALPEQDDRAFVLPPVQRRRPLA